MNRTTRRVFAAGALLAAGCTSAEAEIAAPPEPTPVLAYVDVEATTAAPEKAAIHIELQLEERGFEVVGLPEEVLGTGSIAVAQSAECVGQFHLEEEPGGTVAMSLGLVSVEAFITDPEILNGPAMFDGGFLHGDTDARIPGGNSRTGVTVPQAVEFVDTALAKVCATLEQHYTAIEYFEGNTP